MGKNMLLKDRMNRPCGYVLLMKDYGICRAQAGGTMQAVLLFADGTQSAFDLDGGAEHRFKLDARDPVGCCVISGNDVLLSSGEEARLEYVRQCLLSNRQEENKQMMDACDCEQPDTAGACCECGGHGPGIPADKKENSAAGYVAKDDGYTTTQSEAEFAQRRWPPPPCWQTACYVAGGWQEHDAAKK